MSWGFTGWGTSGWGVTTLAAPLSFVNAFALTTNTVRVQLSTAADVSSPTAVGSATNPASWTITRLDSGFTFTVARVDEVPGSEHTVFDVQVLESFGSLAITHEVSAPGILRDGDNAPMVPPTSFQFAGLGFDKTERPNAPVQRQVVAVDVANPPFPPSGNTIGGTLIINASGDYQSVAGAALVRKLIIRRIMTPLGGFSHLPDYGVGFAVKEKVPTSDLIKLRATLEQQVLLEPEVEQATVIPTLQRSNNILLLQIQAKLRPGGETLNTTVSISQNAVIF